MDDRKKKLYFVIALFFITISIVGIFLIMQTKNDKIMKNVYVDNIDIGDLSKKEAMTKLQQNYKTENIILEFDNKQWIIKPDDIDFNYEIEETVKKSYSLNKQSSMFNNVEQTIKSMFGSKTEVEMSISYNTNKIENKIKEIAKELNVDATDSVLSINGGNISVTEEIVGIKVDEKKTVEAIVEGISKKKFQYKPIVIEDKPKTTKRELENIDTILGSHSTKFDAGVSGRTQNIKLSAQRTSDVLLMPGESFSYNEHTGKRTLSNGYKNAPVIVQGVVQEGIGGGVCQVSTTLYNATLYAGLEYLELRNHSIPSAYAVKGRDATVADGSIDFVFKNNLTYPIYIKNSVYGNTVTCQIYGSSKDKQKIEITTNVDGMSIAPTKRVDDPTLEIGKEKVLEKGRDGYTVSTYRIYRDENGKEIKREKVSKSYYPKKQGVIAVGTKEVVIEPPAPPIEVVPPTPEQPPIEEPTPPQEEVTPPLDGDNTPSEDNNQPGV